MILAYYLGLFIFLLINQSLNIFGGDSAEFSLVARTLSIAHPPGYPLYSLLASAVNAVIPFFTTPWRIAIISSVSTVLTGYLLFRFLRESKISLFSAILSSTLYIFLFPVWLYSEIPEVFALSNVFVMTISYLIFHYVKTKETKHLYAAALLSGMSLSHHHIFILFIPAWIYILLIRKNQLLRLSSKQVLAIAGLVLAGLSFYLYAVIASRFNPPLDWENAKTLEGLVRLFTRATYGTFKAYAGATGNILNQFFDIFSFFIFILHDFRIIGLGLIIAGFFSMRKNRSLFIFISILFGTHVFFLFYTNFVLFGSFTLAMYERFLIPIYLVLIIPFAFGVDAFARIFRIAVSRAVTNPSLLRICRSSVYVFLCGYLAVIVIQNYQLIRRIRTMDYFSVYAKNLLDTVPKGSIFFVGADNSHFTAAYYRFALMYRNDVKFVFVNILDKKHYREKLKREYPQLYIPPDYKKGEDLVSFLKRNVKLGIYFENPLAVNTWKPYGLLWKYYPSEAAAASDSANLVRENARLWSRVYTTPRLDREDRKILHLNVVQDHYMDAYMNYSKLLFATKNIDKAEMVLKDILNNYRKNDPKNTLILVNLFVYENKCKDAKEYLNTLPVENLQSYADYAPSLKDYYDTCDKNNPMRKKIAETLKKNSDTRKSLLKEF